MRKFLGIITAITLVASASAVGAYDVNEVKTVNSFGTVIYEEKYESGIGNTEIKAVSTEKKDNAHGNSLVLTATKGTDALARNNHTTVDKTHNAAQTPSAEKLYYYGIQKISFDFCLDSLSEGYIGLITYKSGIRPQIIRFDTDGKMYFCGTETNVNYQPNKWYNAEVYIDNTNKKCSVYINGNRIVSDTAIKNEETYFTRCDFYLGKLKPADERESAKLYIDNLSYRVLSDITAYDEIIRNDTFDTDLGSYDTSVTVSRKSAAQESEKYGSVAEISKSGSSGVFRLHRRIIDEGYVWNTIGCPLNDNQKSKSKIVEMSVDICPSETDKRVSIQAIGCDGTDTLQTGELVVFRTDGKAWWLSNTGGSNKQISYEANKWYNIKFKLDYIAKKYDAYLNGELVLSGKDASNILKGDHFVSMGISVNDTSVEIDNFCIKYAGSKCSDQLFKMNQNEDEYLGYVSYGANPAGKTFVVAGYDRNGKLMGVSFGKIPESENGAYSITRAMLPSEATDKRYFVWNINTLTPQEVTAQK